jgi:drug/metabolite transporter (DMT)-like permease
VAGPRAHLPILAVVVAVLAWGAGPLLVRSIDAGAPAIIFWRVLFALPIAVATAYLTGGRMSWDLLRRAAPTGVCFALSIVAGFSSFQETSIANATLIPALQPALILCFATRLFGERRSRVELVWAVVAFVGVSVVVLGTSADGATRYGDLLAVANLAVFTGYFLLAKRARVGDVHSWSFLAAVFVVTAVVVVPWALVVDRGVVGLVGIDWVYVLVIVLGPGMIGHGFMTWAHRYVDVGVTSMLTLANPVVSIAGAWWLFSEALGPVQLAGTLAVLVALGMIIRDQRGPRVVAAEAALAGDLLDGVAGPAGPDAPADRSGAPGPPAR